MEKAENHVGIKHFIVEHSETPTLFSTGISFVCLFRLHLRFFISMREIKMNVFKQRSLSYWGSAGFYYESKTSANFWVGRPSRARQKALEISWPVHTNNIRSMSTSPNVSKHVNNRFREITQEKSELVNALGFIHGSVKSVHAALLCQPRDEGSY